MAEKPHWVTLNVYDLSQGLARKLTASFSSKVIEGVWHTGIVVYGNEYFFGGGIQQFPTGTTPYGKPMRTIYLGKSHVPKNEFEMYLQEISHRYTAESYNLLTHNSNNFSNHVSQFLLGQGIPDFILQLPKEAMKNPMGDVIMPMIQNLETNLRSGAVLHFKSEKASKPKDAKTLAPASKEKVKVDPLRNGRSKIQEEITREFLDLMAQGTLGASEAAVMATKRVMQKYGRS